jgi:hypothetical protein
MTRPRFETIQHFVKGTAVGTDQLANRLNQIEDQQRLVTVYQTEATVPKEGTNGERLQDREFGVLWTIVVENTQRGD